MGLLRLGESSSQAGELCFGTIDSWLIYKLTKGRVFATEPSNASRTLLYNIHEGAWDDVLLEALDIPRAMLPEVCDSSGVFGETDAEWFGKSIPIAGVAGDQQSALFGQGCVSKGLAKNTYGTGCFLLMNTGGDAPRSDAGLITVTLSRTSDPRDGTAIAGGRRTQPEHRRASAMGQATRIITSSGHRSADRMRESTGYGAARSFSNSS